jgi:hypothetical protein
MTKNNHFTEFIYWQVIVRDMAPKILNPAGKVVGKSSLRTNHFRAEICSKYMFPDHKDVHEVCSHAISKC